MPDAYVQSQDRLAITLWDFSWYVRTGPGEPFADLDAAFAQAVARGYNCVRVCAMPFLLFRSGLETRHVTFHPLGGGYGQRTRWYDVGGTATVDAREHLLELFRAARRHGCTVIVSSWEYQQSPCFGADDSWFRALMAVAPDDRPAVLADAFADLVDLLRDEGLDEQVAFVELHNEVQIGRLADQLGADPYPGLQGRLEKGIDRFKQRHPSIRVTANYARVPAGRMRFLPRNAEVAVFHPYVYGVLGELVDTFALRDDTRPFPQQRAYDELLRPEAPPLGEWQPPAADRWRMDATVMRPRELYVHDWCDPDAWDRWLYERYGAHHHATYQLLDLWMEVAADWAHERSVPLVFGEGWVGYTPLHTNFEEGPVGTAICRHAVRRSAELGAWGTLVCSNAAPQHPMWQDVALQVELNAAFLEASR
jgi:sugar-binding cellulase-like protein